MRRSQVFEISRGGNRNGSVMRGVACRSAGSGGTRYSVLALLAMAVVIGYAAWLSTLLVAPSLLVKRISAA